MGCRLRASRKDDGHDLGQDRVGRVTRARQLLLSRQVKDNRCQEARCAARTEREVWRSVLEGRASESLT